MWGTAPSGVAVPGAVDSAIAHNQNSAYAGAVNAADAGALFNGGPGTSISITSVGSQNIVSNTVIGNDNKININADQDSSNTGPVSNNGTMNY